MKAVSALTIGHYRHKTSMTHMINFMGFDRGLVHSKPELNVDKLQKLINYVYKKLKSFMMGSASRMGDAQRDEGYSQVLEMPTA